LYLARKKKTRSANNYVYEETVYKIFKISHLYYFHYFSVVTLRRFQANSKRQ